MSDDIHVLRAGDFTAAIKAQGAELCSLRHADGLEFIWQAGNEWPRHAPLLFPIVGRLAHDELRHGGATYRLTQHGFARDRRFSWAERSASACSLVLTDDDATRAIYPFAFRLTASFQLDRDGLELKLSILNTGKNMLPASAGGHPAFNWPLSPGVPKERYALTFEHEERDPIRRLEGGLLREEFEPSPVRGRTLELHEGLFAPDAIIFDKILSKSVRYSAGQGPWVRMSWDGFRELGVWSKPAGAPFICIEPWRGYASPAGFDGPFSDKPGLMHIAPGAEATLSFRIEAGLA